MAITKMIQRCCEFVDEMEKSGKFPKERSELVDCLRTATNGKIYVEVERARLTMNLAMLKEAQGMILGLYMCFSKEK
jgi:26S proteasome regulatory subunit N5